MSLSREPRQEWNFWDQLMQEELQVKRSSNSLADRAHRA
jgi:hypothetical protein